MVICIGGDDHMALENAHEERCEHACALDTRQPDKPSLLRDDHGNDPCEVCVDLPLGSILPVAVLHRADAQPRVHNAAVFADSYTRPIAHQRFVVLPLQGPPAGPSPILSERRYIVMRA
jgi:hypothetical protein